MMPRPGTIVSRSWDAPEMDALTALGKRHGIEIETVLGVLGKTACDVYLNDSTFWRGVPEPVWSYALGGYPVLKKWLSYRETEILGRPLHSQEVRYFAEVVRRLTEVLACGPALDAAHVAARAVAVKWEEGRPVS